MIYVENILICIVIPLIIASFFVKGNARSFSVSFVIGMLVCLVSAYISGSIDVIGGIGSERTSIYVSPMVEELMKLLPMIFFLYIMEMNDEQLILCAVSTGAGFATFENCCCLLTGDTYTFSFVLVRGLAVGVMHIVCMAALTFGLIMARKLKVLSIPSIVGAFSLSCTFHAIYNLLVSKPGVTSYIGFTLPILTAAILYISLHKLIEK